MIGAKRASEGPRRQDPGGGNPASDAGGRPDARVWFDAGVRPDAAGRHPRRRSLLRSPTALAPSRRILPPSCPPSHPPQAANSFTFAPNGYQILTHKPLRGIVNGLDWPASALRDELRAPLRSLGNAGLENTVSDLCFCSALPLHAKARRTQRTVRGISVRAIGNREVVRFVQYLPYWLSTQTLIANWGESERLRFAIPASRGTAHRIP